jgi:hypothetical protein
MAPLPKIGVMKLDQDNRDSWTRCASSTPLWCGNIRSAASARAKKNVPVAALVLAGL